jgi:hypothetical protein
MGGLISLFNSSDSKGTVGLFLDFESTFASERMPFPPLVPILGALGLPRGLWVVLRLVILRIIAYKTRIYGALRCHLKERHGNCDPPVPTSIVQPSDGKAGILRVCGLGNLVVAEEVSLPTKVVRKAVGKLALAFLGDVHT